jgi:glycerol-3-phosphate dehydrogenase (NAD(P)+)
MNVRFDKIGIIGAGSYGTSIAQRVSCISSSVLLVSDMKDIADSINIDHVNRPMLDGVRLSDNISCSTSILTVKDCDIIFVAVPAGGLDVVCHQVEENKLEQPLLLCSKGVDGENARLLSDLAASILTNELMIFSGPSFAYEMASGSPVGINVAGKNHRRSIEIAKNLSHDSFEIKAIGDYIGLQIAGAFKNILAIGCGILSALDGGGNVVAKFIVKGVQEMIDLAIAMGGQKDTFLEFGGIGDTLLTCTSSKSRNVLLGNHLAAGGSLDNWQGSLAEGVLAAKAIPLFQKKYAAELKLFRKIYGILYEGMQCRL